MGVDEEGCGGEVEGAVDVSEDEGVGGEEETVDGSVMWMRGWTR